MASTRKAIYEAETIDTSVTFEKTFPEKANLSGAGRFLRRHRWLIWLGVALAVLAALLWGVVTYVDRVGWDFFPRAGTQG